MSAVRKNDRSPDDGRRSGGGRSRDHSTSSTAGPTAHPRPRPKPDDTADATRTSGHPPTPVDPRPPAELADAARKLFGDRLSLAERYAELLMTDAVLRGLIGPREAPRIWERHLLNCATIIELIRPGCRVVDVGSGAGLPGIVLAIARPDLTMVLVEPLARRTAFLVEAVDALGLDDSTTVVRARAEDARIEPAEVVTARAVAPLDRLAGWCLPLAAKDGRLLALKGDSAADEAHQHEAAVRRLGGGKPTIRLCGVGTIEPPTTVVEVVRERVVRPPRR